MSELIKYSEEYYKPHTPYPFPYPFFITKYIFSVSRMNVTLEEKQVYGIVFAVKNSVLLNVYDLLAHFPALRRILG